MSQDKPELCGAWAGDGLCTMPKGHNMGRLDIPSNHKSEPVVAQEPIFWACYAKEKLVEVTNNTEYVHTFKCNFPLTHRIVPLYDHAAPCADPIAWRNIASPNGIRRFMTQKQYDANPNLQKYYEPFTCARCSELEALYSKLDEHCSAGWDKCDELQAKITEQAEELRIIRANLAQLEKDFDRRNEVVDAQVERIKDLEANKCKPFDENLQMKCVKALLGRTDGELESLSEKMLNSYIEDVTRVYNTITKE